MKKIYTAVLFLSFCFFGLYAQQITITPTGIIPSQIPNLPKLSYEGILALPSPKIGDMAVDLTNHCVRFYSGTQWAFLQTVTDSPSSVTPPSEPGTRYTTITPSGISPISGGRLPQLSYTAILALPSPQTGDMVMDLSNNCVRSYNGNAWIKLQSAQDTQQPAITAQQCKGPGDQTGRCMTKDAGGNVYVVGYFFQTATFGSTTLTSAGSQDIFIAKYAANGTLRWVQRTGNVNFDSGLSIATDVDGNVYITGLFAGTTTIGTTNLTSVGAYDVYVAKYDSNGMFQWVKQAGGTGNDYGWGVATDANGYVYITGYISGTATFGPHTLISQGSTDLFLAKYDSNGTLQWAKRDGGTGNEYAYDMATDGNGNMYIVGYFTGTATFGTTNLTSAGNEDVFVVKYNSDGITQWAQRGGGTGSDITYDIATDSNGNTYITGSFLNTATFSGGSSVTSFGNSDIFLAKYNSAGTLQWLRRTGGINYDYMLGIDTDTGGNSYITGYFYGHTTIGTTNFVSAGERNIFIAKYNSSGTFQWAQHIISTGSDHPYDLAVTLNGNIYGTMQMSGIAAYGSTKLTTTGAYDYFLMRMVE